jgi:hypothetical protein
VKANNVDSNSDEVCNGLDRSQAIIHANDGLHPSTCLNHALKCCPDALRSAARHKRGTNVDLVVAAYRREFLREFNTEAGEDTAGVKWLI